MNSDDRWSATPPSRSYPKGDRRRTEIVRAAFSAFSADGYRGASMVQIAAACGVSRAGLLHHFPSKELLLAAVLTERDRINGELFFAGMAAPGADGLDYFRRLLRVIEHNASQREIVSLFATLSTEAADPAHPAHAYFANRYRWLRADIADALAELAGRGLLRDQIDIVGAATDLVALIDGLQIQWLLDAESVDIPARVRTRLEELLISPLGD